MMRQSKRSRKAAPRGRSRWQFSFEPLEPRILLSVADPAIAFVASRFVKGSNVYDLTVVNADGTNQAVIWSRSSPVNQLSWSPDRDKDSINGYQGAVVMEVIKQPGFPTFSVWMMDVEVTAGGIRGTNLRNLITTVPLSCPRSGGTY